MRRSDITRKDHGRFDLYYTHGPIDQCWEWRGQARDNTYPLFELRKTVSATHVAYCLEYGDFEGQLLHSCDNPPCVNPNHLFLASQKDNIQDMISKGRHPITGVRGNVNPIIRITDEDVDFVRELYKSGSFTQEQLARRFQVSRSLIQGILNGSRRSYK